MRHRSIPVVLSALLALALCAADRRLSARETPAAAAHAPSVSSAPAPKGEHGGGGETEKEAPVNPLAPQFPLAVWTLVVFVLLLAVLRRFAWGPLMEALHNRESHLERVLQDTEKARNESEALLAEHRKQMARAAEEVRGILDKARQDAQASADHIVGQARDEADQARQRAQRDIATARDQALAEIWRTSAETAVSVAGRVLSQQLGEDDHRRLLDAAIRELPAVATANGHGGPNA